VGKPFTALVPLADADGLDRAGIRMPEIAAPLGTYTGWNLYNATTGAAERLARTDGSFVPFARNEGERIAADDPRPAIAQRYANRDAYLEAYAAATLALANKELIVGSDINDMVEKAGGLYDRLMKRAPGTEGCGYLKAE
jgi:hypothetical protein